MITFLKTQKMKIKSVCTYLMVFSEACLELQHFLHFANTSFRSGLATTRALEPSFLDELEEHSSDANIFQAQVLTRKTFSYRSLGVQGAKELHFIVKCNGFQ